MAPSAADVHPSPPKPGKGGTMPNEDLKNIYTDSDDESEEEVVDLTPATKSPWNPLRELFKGGGFCGINTQKESENNIDDNNLNEENENIKENHTDTSKKEEKAKSNDRKDDNKNVSKTIGKAIHNKEFRPKTVKIKKRSLNDSSGVCVRFFVLPFLAENVVLLLGSYFNPHKTYKCIFFQLSSIPCCNFLQNLLHIFAAKQVPPLIPTKVEENAKPTWESKPRDFSAPGSEGRESPKPESKNRDFSFALDCYDGPKSKKKTTFWISKKKGQPRQLPITEDQLKNIVENLWTAILVSFLIFLILKQLGFRSGSHVFMST
mmetsp:Transcript_23176/g.34049  ORF Transcript_23176/g.34049 Transcript_23176/m.34049 type:complete len:319 (-) Transcript_23176:841-1797(-)